MCSFCAVWNRSLILLKYVDTHSFYQSTHAAPEPIQESPGTFANPVASSTSGYLQKYDPQYTKYPFLSLRADHTQYQRNLGRDDSTQYFFRDWHCQNVYGIFNLIQFEFIGSSNVILLVLQPLQLSISNTKCLSQHNLNHNHYICHSIYILWQWLFIMNISN